MILRTFVTTSLALLLTSVAFAAGPITIAPAGNNTYIVNGSLMDGVAGIELQITYAAPLGTPTITAGSLVSGAIFAANPNSPGLIRVAIISTSPFSGNGPIAKIVFASGSNNAADPQLASYSMIDSKGATLSSQTTPVSSLPDPTITSAGIPFSSTPTPTTPSTTPSTATNTTTTTTTTTSTTSSGTSSTPTYLGTVAMPQESHPQPDVKTPTPKQEQPVWDQPAPPPAEQPQFAEKSVPVKKETETETEQYLVYTSVSERFKQYNGEKSLAKLSELFKREVSSSIHQDPSPMLSDGTTLVTLTVDLPSRITAAPNFAINGAKLLSHKQEPTVKGRWIVTALPEAATSATTLTIIAGSEAFEYPLTLAPPHRTTLKLDEAGWNTFLTTSGTAEAPLYDLNQDGVRDYLDEFIFVTNYLVQKTVRPVPPAVSAPPAVAPTTAPPVVPPKGTK
jgi:hypothetical protein